MYSMQLLVTVPIILIFAAIAMAYCIYQIIRSISIAKTASLDLSQHKTYFYIGLMGSVLYLIVEIIRFFLTIINLFGFHIEFSQAGTIEAAAMLILACHFIFAFIKSHSKYRFRHAIGALGFLLSGALYFYNVLLQFDALRKLLPDFTLHRYIDTCFLLLLLSYFILEYASRTSKEKNSPFVGVIAIAAVFPANLFFYFDVLQFAYYFPIIFAFIDTLYMIFAMLLTIYFIKKLILKDPI